MFLIPETLVFLSVRQTGYDQWSELVKNLGNSESKDYRFYPYRSLSR